MNRMWFTSFKLTMVITVLVLSSCDVPTNRELIQSLKQKVELGAATEQEQRLYEAIRQQQTAGGPHNGVEKQTEPERYDSKSIQYQGLTGAAGVNSSTSRTSVKLERINERALKGSSTGEGRLDFTVHPHRWVIMQYLDSITCSLSFDFSS